MFIASAPAEAACTAPNPVTCSAAFDSSTANPGGLGGLTLNGGLSVIYDNTASDTSATFVNVGPGASAGALSFTIQNGATQASTAFVSFLGDPTKAANTGTLDNSGALNGTITFGYDGTGPDPLSGDGFGGAITATNESTGVIGTINLVSVAGETLTNKAGGTIGTIYLDSGYLDTTVVTAPTTDGTNTTDIKTDTHTTSGGTDSFTNAGAVTGNAQVYGKDTNFTNSGTVGGDVTVESANTWGPNTTTVTTEVYNDPTFLLPPPGNMYGGFPSYDQITVVTKSTAFGGSSTFVNSGAAAVISGNVDQTAAKDASFSNAAEIDGAVDITTTDAATANSTKVTTVGSGFFGQNFSGSFSATSTPTGGSITADNAAKSTIKGDFSANAATNDTVTNEGLLSGNVSVESTVSAVTASGFFVDNEANFVLAPAPVVVVAPAAPPNTTTTTTDFTADTTSSKAFGVTFTKTSVGGTASFTNSSTVGDKATPVDVNVVGDTAATASNTGTIFGTVEVTSAPNTTSASFGGDKIVGKSFTDHKVQVVTDDTVHVPFTSSLSDKGTGTFINTKTFAASVSTVYGAGSASLTNAAKATITGDVTVQDAGSASLDNSGTLLGAVSVLATDANTTKTVSLQDSAGTPGVSGTFSFDIENTAAYTGGDLIETDAFNATADIVKSYNDTTSFSLKTVGSTATLKNEKGAVIGDKALSVPVTVAGQASATATNAGTIFGATTVTSADGSFATSKVDSGKLESTKTFSFTVNKDDTTATTNEMTFAFGDTEVGSTLAGTAFAATATGGDSLFTNTGTNTGDVNVLGVTLAELDNTGGTITGDVGISATGNDLSFGIIKTTSTDDTAEAAIDVKFATKGGTTTTTATGSANATTNDSTGFAFAVSSKSVGGDAVLKNAAKSTITGNVTLTGDTTATATNDGTIVGDLTVTSVSTDKSFDVALTDVTTSTDAKTFDSTYIDDGVTPYFASFKSTEDTTGGEVTTATFDLVNDATGGTATLNNNAAGVITGNVVVQGPLSATVTNAGFIGGDLSVISDGLSKVTHDKSTDTTNKTSHTETDNEATLAAGVVSYVDDTKGSAHTDETVVTTKASSTTQVGGNATLTNTGIIGTLDSTNNTVNTVTVDQGGTATVVNDGVIFANLIIGKTSTDKSATSADTTKTTDDSTFDNAKTLVDKGKGAVETSFDNKATDATTLDEVSSSDTTTKTVGGSASYSGTGQVIGSMSLTSVGDASAEISNQVGNPVTGFGTFFVTSFGISTDLSKKDHTTGTDTKSSEDVSPDEASRTVTTNEHITGSDTFDNEFTLTPTGGMATLVVDSTGILGGDSQKPMDVEVLGQAGATLLNSGHINGNVLVQSKAFAGTFSKIGTTTHDEVTSSTSTTLDPVKFPLVVTTVASSDVTTDTANTTTTFAFKSVGGMASATNLSKLTITGDLTVKGTAGAIVTNPGGIWGNVEVDSQGIAIAGSLVTTSATTTSVIFALPILTSTTDIATTSDFNLAFSNNGHDATLNNTGNIGLRTNDTNGLTTVSGGNVDMNANGNVIATNGFTGVIYGDVTGTATGTAFTLDAKASDTSKTVATSNIITGVTVTTLKDVATKNVDTTTKATGGTATMTNTGSIGQRFASNAAAGGGLTDGHGVVMSGDAGASIINSGSIGKDAQAFSSATNDVFSSAETVTTTSQDTTPTAAPSDFKTIVDVASSTDTTTAAGGKGTITNNKGATIGIDVLDGFSVLRSDSATIVASGDAGALITNAGLMQGNTILASSNTENGTTVTSSTTTTHYLYNAIKAKVLFNDDTIDTSSTATSTATGGTAEIDNSGSMLSDGPLTVTVSGFGGATLRNAITGVIDGDVNVYSSGVNTVDTDVVHQTDVGFFGTKLLFDKLETTSHTETEAGGVALLDNQGSITNNIGGGNVLVNGFTAGTVINEKGASIAGNVEADSVFFTKSWTAVVETQGPANPTPSPTPLDSYTETDAYVGNDASIDNFSAIGGNAVSNTFGNGLITNEVGATIGGHVDMNSFYLKAVEVNTNGAVTETPGGGTSTFNNLGNVGDGFQIVSWAGSTLTNAASASIDTDTDADLNILASAIGTNTFSNAGLIGPLPTGDFGTGMIEFAGNTVADNTGIITEDLVFNNFLPGSVATFNFHQGSVLTGDINNPADVGAFASGGLSNLTVNFMDSGAYPGNMFGVTTTNKTGPGAWIVTGNHLEVGSATVSGGLLQFGIPARGDADALLYSGTWDPYFNLPNPLAGNTALDPSLNSIASGLSPNIILAPAGTRHVIGNITIGPNGAVFGDTLFIGNITNNGMFLSGYMLPGGADKPLGNLLDNTNRILPGHDEISGNYTQSATGTLLTSFAPTIDHHRDVVGTQPEIFAPTSFWLSVSPFVPDTHPSTLTTVDGTATVAGTVKVYVNREGLYVNGDSRDVMTSKGAMTVTATTSQSAPSLFVGFKLATRSAGGVNVLSTVVSRTSYSSVGATPNEVALGLALDSAVPDVAAKVAANAFPSVAAFNATQDLAGFLTDMDWNVATAAQAEGILNDLSPDEYASLAAIDTSAGFRAQILRHLTEQRGVGAQDDPAVGAWVQAYGLTQNVSDRHGIKGLKSSTSGISVGWDAQLDNVVLGMAGGYSRTSVGTHNTNFGGEVTSYQAGGYGTATWGPWYVDATLWGDFGNGTITRVLPHLGRVGVANVKPDGFHAEAEGGYRFVTDEGFGLTPYISIGYRNSDYGHFSETGLGGLGYNISGANASLFTPELGVTADGNYEVTSMITVKPLIGLAVIFNDSPDVITAQFQGGGNSFTLKSPLSSNAAFRPEAGVDIKVGQSVSVQMGYQGTLGGGVDSNGGYLGLRMDW